MQSPRVLIPVAAILTFVVVTLGAFVRLSNAGLGCPDWPGCYGYLAVPASLAESGGEAHMRAWIEMIHRYAAGTLGLVILVLAWQHRRDPRGRRIGLALVALLVFQALLGMWTVTLKLMPLVVMGHLLGGLSILALLWLWHLRATPFRAFRWHPLGYAALLAVIVQIALGGWTSANYAAIACPDFPTCQGAWWPEADFAGAFRLPEPVAGSYEGGAHDGSARTAMHFSHRLGAVAVLAFVGLFAVSLIARGGAARNAGMVLAGALGLQLFLGAANVLLHLPLAVAVAHTAGAALLLVALLATLRSPLRAFA